MDKRTVAERKADDRESVRTNINDLGAYGALRYASKRLEEMPLADVRRILILTIRGASKIIDRDLAHARRLAAGQTVWLKSIGIKVAVLLALATAAEAQTSIVYTNVVDGRAYRQSIVRVERPAQLAAPVPASIVTTEVPPRNYKTPIGAASYVPPTRSPWGETRAARPTPVEQPWFINGIYAGPSPSGNWMSTAVGRPIVDVNVIGIPRRPQ